MTKKEKFIEAVDNALFSVVDINELDPDIVDYWNAFKGSKEEKEKPLFTENGKLILKFMQENTDKEMFKAKDIADQILLSSRSVAGAARKLVLDGFLEKNGQDPVLYSITEKGKNIEII